MREDGQGGAMTPAEIIAKMADCPDCLAHNPHGECSMNSIGLDLLLHWMDRMEARLAKLERGEFADMAHIVRKGSAL